MDGLGHTNCVGLASIVLPVDVVSVTPLLPFAYLMISVGFVHGGDHISTWKLYACCWCVLRMGIGPSCPREKPV